MPLTELKPVRDSTVIWAMLPEIEAALARGVTRQQVLDTLRKEHGLTLELRGFDSALRRARKARDKQKTTAHASLPPKVDHAKQVTPPGGVSSAVDTKAGRAVESTPPENPPQPPSDPHSARLARQKIEQTDYSDLDERYK
jgi:hypothetical protein